MKPIARDTAERKSRPVKTTDIPVAPWTITPINCEQVAGAKPRWVREKFTELGLPLRKSGKMFFITPQEWQRFLDMLAKSGQSIDEAANDDGQPQTCDDVLARLGLRAVR